MAKYEKNMKSYTIRKSQEMLTIYLEKLSATYVGRTIWRHLDGILETIRYGINSVLV